MLTIREVATTDADQRSARSMFRTVLDSFDLKEAKALDMFARTGELTVVNYRHAVKELHLWELMPEHERALWLEHAPHTVKIGCSYQSALNCTDKFDFIVIDSPQGAHSDYSGAVHYEHFDVVRELLPKLAADNCVVVLYVNKAPYNKEELGSHGYDQYSEYDFPAWMQARRMFYGSIRVTEEQAIKAYRDTVQEWATVDQVIVTPCHSDVPGYPPYAFRLALSMKRK